MATLILVSGKARRGKDTVAEYLKERYGYSVFHWADALREELSKPMDISVTFSESSLKARVTINDVMVRDTELARMVLYWMSEQKNSGAISYSRSLDVQSKNGLNYYEETYSMKGHRMQGKDCVLMQWYGTEYRRNHFDKAYWVKRTVDSIRRALYDDQDVVIADTRFLNEIEAGRNIAEADRVLLVRVERDHPIEDAERDEEHSSEMELNDYDGWHIVLKNDADIDSLKATMDGHLKSMV